jgi:hypothetical protein
MPFDGNGVFSRVFTSWQSHADAGIGIEPGLHDEEDDSFAASFNKAFCRDGQAAATGDFDMDSHLIHNLGLATLDGDAVSLGQVTGSGGYPPLVYKKGPEISGADLNGRLNFSSATGVNGIGWLGADLSWVAKIFKTGETRNRLVLNDKYDATGSDVIICDDAGNVNLTSLTANLSLDTANQWRTIAPGYGFRAALSSQAMTLFGVDTATVTDPYMPVTLQPRFSFGTSAGSAAMTLTKQDANGKTNIIYGYRGANPRWRMELGNGTTEDTSSAGSDFYLYSYSNAAVLKASMYAYRKNGKVGFPSGLTGVLQIDNAINNEVGVLVLGGVGGAYLRPNSYDSAVGQIYVSTAGYCQLGTGVTERSGTGGSFGSQIYNSLYVASNDLRWYVGASTVGYYTPACDHRIKRDVRPLPSTWDAVKALKPVIFKDAAFGEPGPENPFHDGEFDRVGFLAFELQDALGEQAATGTKDGPDIQGPDVMAVVAALTATIQEAQLRIEALEAA